MVTKTLLKLGTALAATIVAGTLFAKHLPRPEQSATSADGANGSGPAEQHRWSLAFDVTLGQPTGGTPVQIRLTGEWVATVSATRDGETDVAHEIAGAHVEGGGVNPRRDEIEALERRLSRRFWVTYRSDGTALRSHFPKDVVPGDRNLLQMIVTETQLVRGDRNAAQWTALERDGGGLYLAAYQSAPGAITKHKLKYIELDGAAGPNGGDGVRVRLEQGESRFSLDATGQLAAFNGNERMHVGMMNDEGGSLDIRTATQLSNLRVLAAPGIAGSLERARASVESEPIRTQKLDPETVVLERDQRLLDGHSADALLSAASAASKDSSLPSRLAALFRRQPDAVLRALELVRREEGLQTITNALASSGATVALDGLGRLIHDVSRSDAMRIQAMTALLLVQRPNEAAMRVTLDLVDDSKPEIRHTAAMVCAALARSGRTDHPADAAAIDEALLSRWAKASNVEERTPLLAALGNSVGPEVVPIIEQAAHDEQVQVRVAAARALRLAQASDVDELLGRVITTDTDPRVRSAAIFAADFRSWDLLVAPLVKAATSDPIEYVRSDAVRFLRKHVDASEEIAATLDGIAKHDPKPGVRRLASVGPRN